jgi:PTS system nitrogen regulatory IIA component
MRISDFVVREAIIPDLQARDKEGVIREMVEGLRATGHLKTGAQESVVQAILKRERLGSMGIGRGVAIPHTKHESVERLVGSVAISKDGVPFESLDDGPVHILFMLISPQERSSEHLRALENISRCLRDDTFCRCVRQARTREEIWELLTDAESGG